MKKTVQYLWMLVAVAVMASCSQEEALEAARQQMTFVVGGYPAFGETPSRTVGIPDEGKTEWADGDAILVSDGVQGTTLTYQDGVWAPAGSVSLTGNVTAVYAPGCEIAGNAIALKDGSRYGLEEYIVALTQVDGNTLYISFEGVHRTYSRLRIAAAEGDELTVSVTGFTPAGSEDAAAAESYTLVADAKGNAYLYGVFAPDGTVEAKEGTVTLATHTFTGYTEAEKSYVLNGTGYELAEANGQKTYTVHTAKGLLAWNKAAQSDLTLNLTLAADITLPVVAAGESNWTAMGTSEYTYTGTIDGCGHTITGLRINNSLEYQGFVGKLGEGGTVKNLTFADAVLSVGQFSGIVAGGAGGTIENCHVKEGSSITGSEGYIGGIVGSALSSGGVIGCTNAATVTEGNGSTRGYVGGIVGTNTLSQVFGCLNHGSVTGYSLVGGIAGKSDRADIVACGNTAEVVATSTSGTIRVGGIIGSYGGNNPKAKAVASWTVDTNETGSNPKDGIGYRESLSEEPVACNSFASESAADATAIGAMNTAVATYNTTATVKCNYQWEASTDGGWPTLKPVTE